MTYTAMAVSLVGGFLIVFFEEAALLPLLRRMQFQQHAYEDAPEPHQKKTGTPTMGGILFGLAMLPLFANYRNVAWLARSHAVTVVPSASAIVTLRRLPHGCYAATVREPQASKFAHFPGHVRHLTVRRPPT